MTFVSHSQAGQDRWAFEVLSRPPTGTFFDIGSNHPIERNNTYALEQLGWSGLCVELDDYCLSLAHLRRCAVLQADATIFDFGVVAPEFRTVDFLSLDVDAATPAALRNLLDCGIRWRAGCIETDLYRFGTEPHDRIRQMLLDARYNLLCEQVCDQGCPFEIWCVDPLVVDMAVANRFRCEGPVDWREVLRQGGVT